MTDGTRQACLLMCLFNHRITIGVPFLCLFMIGYLYVPLTTWFGHRLGRQTAETPATPPKPAEAPVRNAA